MNEVINYRCRKEIFKASDGLRDDPDFMTQAIEKFGMTILCAASERLRNDRDFILSLIERERYWAEAFEYASEDMRNDPLFIEEALKANLNVFRHLKKKWRYHFIDYALQQPSVFFSRFPKEMQDDETLVLNVIKSNPDNYRYASERLQNDPRIVMEAITRQGSLLEYVPECFKDNDNIVYVAVSKDSSAFQYASPRLRDYYEIARMAIMDDPRNFRYASERLRDDEALASLSMDGYGRINYEHLSPRLQQDSHMVALKETFTLDDCFMGCQ